MSKSNEQLKNWFLERYQGSTQKSYREWINEFEKVIGNKPFSELTIADIRKYREHLQAAKYKSAIVKWATIKSFIGDVIKRAKYPEYLPFLAPEELKKFNRDLIDIFTIEWDEYRTWQQVNKFKNGDKEEMHARVLRLEELRKLISMIYDPRDLCAIMLGIKCGLRISEITGVELEDICWQDKSIKIRTYTDEDNRKHGKSTRKAGSDERIIFYDDEMERVLRTWYNLRSPTDKTKALINGVRGRMTGETIARILRSYAYKAELIPKEKMPYDQDVTPHCLRKSLYTYWKNAAGGVVSDYLRAYFGHAQTDQMTKAYGENYLELVKEEYLKIVPILMA